MRNSAWVGVILTVLTVGGSAAWAQSDPVKPGAAPHRTPFANVQERLKLTDEQRKQALELRESYHKRVYDLRCKLRVKKAERRKEMQQPNPDKDKLQALSQEIGQLNGQILVEDTNSRADFEKILTPQQLVEWKKFRDEHKGHEPGAGDDAK